MAKMVQFLIAQGCVTYDGTREKYSLWEIKYLVRALTSQWYGIYYSHPFWDDLRRCRLSLPQVFAWVLRTYHLSRSAGATAARGAVHGPNPQVRAAFLRSAIEEYSHCESYYFPAHRTFGLEDQWIQDLVPFPSSVAFDHQMAVIAEDDWLAHTVVAFFQEYTARFRENAFALYDRIEATYGLHEFFRGWKEHIGYDVDQTHCDNFEDLFEGSSHLSPAHLVRSLQAAAITVEYLVSALDELSNVKTDVSLKTLRVSPVLVRLGARHTSLLGGLKNLDGLCGESRYAHLCRLLEETVSHVVGDQKNEMAAVISAALLPVLPDLLVRSLARCTDQQYVVLLGSLLKESLKDASSVESESNCLASKCAVMNFLREFSVSPAEFVFLVLLASRLIGLSQEGRSSPPNRLRRMQVIIEQRLEGIEFCDEDRLRFVTLGLQFAELCQTAAHWGGRIPDQDVLLPAPPSPVEIPLFQD